MEPALEGRLLAGEPVAGSDEGDIGIGRARGIELPFQDRGIAEGAFGDRDLEFVAGVIEADDGLAEAEVLAAGIVVFEAPVGVPGEIDVDGFGADAGAAVEGQDQEEKGSSDPGCDPGGDGRGKADAQLVFSL
jgi:hypothetical protein